MQVCLKLPNSDVYSNEGERLKTLQAEVGANLMNK